VTELVTREGRKGRVGGGGGYGGSVGLDVSIVNLGVGFFCWFGGVGGCELEKNKNKEEGKKKKVMNCLRKKSQTSQKSNPSPNKIKTKRGVPVSPS